jgi:hypothetical protein
MTTAQGATASTLEPKRMQCMEVWGGNRSIDSGVIMPIPLRDRLLAPLRDRMLAPLRLIADFGGVHFNWK